MLALIKSKGVLEGINDSLKIISKTFDYLFHPAKILICLWNRLVNISGNVLLISALACIILYILGYKKYGKGVTLSFISYVVIQAIGIIEQ